MLILASQSPRRKELLAHLHMPFAVRVANIDEAMDSAKPPAEEVARVSLAKALAVPREGTDVIIAADTIVVLDGKILGKPADEADAHAMLSALSGRAHQVMTGLTVLQGDKHLTHTEITDVYFRPISQTEIDRYVRSGDPMDKAGSYGIQGGASLFVEKLHGDYYNVMGLPVCRLWQMLGQLAPQTLEDFQ